MHNYYAFLRADRGKGIRVNSVESKNVNRHFSGVGAGLFFKRK